MMRTVASIVLVGWAVLCWSQSDTTSVDEPESKMWRQGIGMDISAMGETYSGIAFTYIVRANSGLFATADVKFVLEGDPIIRGTETEVGIGYLFAGRMFPKLGAFYHTSTMQEDPIVSRVSGAFFEELELDQKREYYGGTFGLGAIFPIGDGAAFMFEIGMQFGTEVINQKVVTGDYTYVDQQDIDERYIFNTESEMRESLVGANIDLTFIVTF